MAEKIIILQDWPLQDKFKPGFLKAVTIGRLRHGGEVASRKPEYLESRNWLYFPGSYGSVPMSPIQQVNMEFCLIYLLSFEVPHDF